MIFFLLWRYSCHMWSSRKQSFHCSSAECLWYIAWLFITPLPGGAISLANYLMLPLSLLTYLHTRKQSTSTEYVSRWWLFSRTLRDGWCCSIPQALKSKYANLYIAGAADPEGDYQLDVDVSGLIFSHHPLFSREHVLGARLAQLYDQYLTRQHNNLTGHLTDKVNSISRLSLSSRAVTTTVRLPYIPEYI